MAIAYRVTKKEQKAEARSKFRLVCKGLSKAEFSALYQAFKNDFGCETVLRNLFRPEFDPKAINEIIVHLTGSAIGLYVTKKAIDAAQELFIAFVKFKFMTPSENGHVRHIELYGHDGKLCEFKDKKGKPKKK